eukprot:tig00021293_g20008.t1
MSAAAVSEYDEYGAALPVRALDFAGDSAAFLVSFPRGAYTTARTSRSRTALFDFSFHVTRIATSVASIFPTLPERLRAYCDEARVRTAFRETIRHAVGLFEARHACEAGDELKVTTLVFPTSEDLQAESTAMRFLTHVQLIPKPPTPASHRCTGCRGAAGCAPLVTVYPRPTRPAFRRKNPNAKDSAWVRERKALEEQKPAGVHEVLLSTPDGRLLEGLSSNFAALRNGTLYTAGDDLVLQGTMREMVLRICGEARPAIEVVLEAPRWEEAETWDTCFITSTSRFVLPISELRLPSPRAVSFADRPPERTAALRHVRDAIFRGVEANSEPLSPPPSAAL